MTEKRINCLKCEHLKITWEPAFPYACKAMNFKSGTVPSLEVFRSSGLPCQMFVPKHKEGS
jgi:hypothetical protein